MKVMQTQSNIVILASNHDPRIVTKDWLNQKKILTEESINYIHTPGFSLVETGNYTLQIDQQQLNIGLKNFNENILSPLPVIACKYVEALPEIPYRAVGLNSNWIVQLERPNVLKEIFVAKPKRLDAIFHEGIYNIGGIVIYEYDPFRLQLTVSPERENNVSLAFNYHSDVSGAAELSETISHFTKVTEHACSIAIELLGGE